MARVSTYAGRALVVCFTLSLGACDRSTPWVPTGASPVPSAVVSAAPVTVAFTALSQGRPANPATCGGAVFQRNGVTFYSGRGCTFDGARGFNIAAIDPSTADLREPVQHFDTWLNGALAARATIAFIDRQPSGTLLLVAVGDEGGLTVGATAGCSDVPTPGSTCCRLLGGDFERLRQSLEMLGARQVSQYCYWNSYSMIAIKGGGVQAEQLVPGRDAVTRYALTLK